MKGSHCCTQMYLQPKGASTKSCWPWVMGPALSTPKASGICCLQHFPVGVFNNFHCCPAPLQRHTCGLQRHGWGWLVVVIQALAWTSLTAACFLSFNSEWKKFTWKWNESWTGTISAFEKWCFFGPQFSVYRVISLLLYSFCVITKSMGCWEGVKHSLPPFTWWKITDLCYSE